MKISLIVLIILPLVVISYPVDKKKREAKPIFPAIFLGAALGVGTAAIVWSASQAALNEAKSYEPEHKPTCEYPCTALSSQIWQNYLDSISTSSPQSTFWTTPITSETTTTSTVTTTTTTRRTTTTAQPTYMPSFLRNLPNNEKLLKKGIIAPEIPLASTGITALLLPNS